MRVPTALYHTQATLARHLPTLRPAQARGLALWVYGTVLARSACQSAVIAALAVWAPEHALRQRLREWLWDGPDKAAPCRTQLEVERCFAPLLSWVLAGWRAPDLALCIDATTRRDSLTVLVVSVLYRSSAIPVAWAVLPGNTKGPWLAPILGLLQRLAPAVPARLRVLVLADRGLWSPRLWAHICQLGWHPLLRVQNHITVTPEGRPRCRARDLVEPGHAWLGRARLGAAKGRTLGVTLIVVWQARQKEPWALVTDLSAAQVGPRWYALRMWVELGFRALKSMGWHWQRTRRTDPRRAGRHFLVVAVASLLALGYGTRAEDGGPARSSLARQPRTLSTFQRGLSWLGHGFAHGRPWRRLRFVPEPWPQPPQDLIITRHTTEPT